MGAPKQKWTAEEEAALKAGVVKHGAGKWRTILTDPEFSSILRMRSNVDLKDKWRNINVTAIWGSRQKAKLALKKNLLLPAPKIDNDHMALSTAVRHDENVLETKPLAICGLSLPSHNSKQQLSRLDDHILEAIISLKEPRGSDRNAIASYIEENYQSPTNLGKLLRTRLKHMVDIGKIIKVQQRYKISPSSTGSEKRRYSSSTLPLEGRPRDSPEAEKSHDVNILSKSQVDADISKAKSMTAQEAAVAAAKAVAEAEAAIAEAELAAREAEAAEAEAEAAHVFAKAAMKALKCKTSLIW
ncbi:hypothetical protein HN51_062100 [Arachis hypogaea]|uniref:MYB transcription factor n=1 Tax=Arachis hypogaea TaxID=3818 RepID=A0A445AR86_ARAHY|nr:telomere repeat-binding factor 2 [Arachis hypogaea]QHO19461.1 Telomere repeat-binding factor [Arachis hypogaea]RYR28900.1 hypothetical protein Ahy_B01g053118 [Arachis hypogaea]